MAGHSQFKNIMYRKGAQDAKRAKVFSKIIRELTLVARVNPDPESNPALRAAIAAARGANMPKDKIERAIKRGAGGGEDDALDEIRYEGYGPGGVAIIVEALTDNRNRTVGEVRAAFAKHGGSLGEAGSVAFIFQRVGSVQYDAEAASAEEMFEAALEAGADDCESNGDGHEVTCAPAAFHDVREALAARFGAAWQASLIWNPESTVEIDEAGAEALFRLLEVLDDNDDVQRVSANFDVSDDILRKLSA